jgi:hypothetical protein
VAVLDYGYPFGLSHPSVRRNRRRGSECRHSQRQKLVTAHVHSRVYMEESDQTVGTASIPSRRALNFLALWAAAVRRPPDVPPGSAPGPGVRGGLGQPGLLVLGLAGRTPPERAAARDTGLVVPVGQAAEDRARTGRRPKRRIRSGAAAPRGAGRARPVRSAPLTGGVANPRPGATSNPASTGACPPGNFLCDRRVATMPYRALLRLVTVRTVSDRGKAAG